MQIHEKKYQFTKHISTNPLAHLFNVFGVINIPNNMNHLPAQICVIFFGVSN